MIEPSEESVALVALPPLLSVRYVGLPHANRDELFERETSRRDTGPSVVANALLASLCGTMTGCLLFLIPIALSAGLMLYLTLIALTMMSGSATIFFGLETHQQAQRFLAGRIPARLREAARDESGLLRTVDVLNDRIERWNDSARLALEHGVEGVQLKRLRVIRAELHERSAQVDRFRSAAKP